MICQKCGYNNGSSSKFCIKCGFKLLLNNPSESIDNSRKLAYVVAENEVVNDRILDSTVNKNINGLVSYSCTDIMGKKCFKYDINNLISIKEFLSKQVQKKEMITLLMNLINTLITIQALDISSNNVFMNLNQVFINKNNLNIKLLCIPISNRKKENNIKELIHQIITFSEFDYNEDSQYVKDILEYIEVDKSDDVGQLMGILIKYDDEISKEIELKNEININNTKTYNETSILENEEFIGTTLLSDEMKICPYLIRKNNNEKISINKQRFRIGKDYRNSDYAVIDNSAVSRKHADIVERNGVYYIIDLNSTNHVFINGKRIKEEIEIEIPKNSIIKLGNEEFSIFNN